MNAMHTRLLALLLAAAFAIAADAPTDAEWAPAAKALASGSPDAAATIEAITTQYPKWPDGHRALAQVRLAAGDAKAAWSSARQALILKPDDATAGAIGVQALSSLVAAGERAADGSERKWSSVWAVADKFNDGTDPAGLVASQAAVAALIAGDDDALGRYLPIAKVRSGSSGSPILDFVEAKQAFRRGELAAGTVALERAVAARPDYRDALFELGRVRTIAALECKDAEQAIALFNKAEESLAAAARLDAHDASARFGLGRAWLEHGKRMIANGQIDGGESSIRNALMPLDEGLQLVPADRDGKLWKGDALLRLRRYEEAVPLLKQALAGGATDRALPFNLALALSKCGRDADAAEVLSGINAETVDERLNIAMNLFHQGNWENAKAMLIKAIVDIQEGEPRRSVVKRFIAHCEREMSAAEGDPARKDELMVSAIEHYREAGNERDFPSRHWYLALVAPRSPLEAFKAGKQSMAWDGFWNPPAWKLLVANYGYKLTGGNGLGGLFSKSNLAHTLLWILLVFLCFCGFLYSLVAKQKKPEKAKPATKPGTSVSRKPGTSKSARPATAATRKVPTMPARMPTPLPNPGNGPKTPFSE